jgi:polar amino acid transport system substrate-binding protein
MRVGRLAPAAVLALLAAFGSAEARSLDQIKESRTLGLCAHPNSLPFASKKDDPPGFEIELGRAVAQALGVSLVPDWIIAPSQIFRADCDIMLDVIADQQAQSESGLKISKPYYHTGVALAVPAGSAVHGFADLNAKTKVGVMVGSTAAMTLQGRGVKTSTFGFEDEMMAALAAHEIDVAAVTPAAAGYFNATHPQQKVTILPPDDGIADMTWNVSVGMRRPDGKLREAIDATLAQLWADGTIHAIYGRYGIDLQAPK